MVGPLVDAIMVGSKILCGNGWDLSGRYHGWPVHAAFGWILSARYHGGSFMLCGNGWGLVDVIMIRSGKD